MRRAVLNRIATANVDVAVGRCVYTQFLNAAGGIEADLTVTRLAADRFLVVTAAFTQTHVEAWIRNQIPDGRVLHGERCVRRLRDAQCPGSRLARSAAGACRADDFSTAAFPFATCREVRIGYQTALALRLTFVGELGWELYIPTSFAQPVYDALIEAGKAHGLKHCGYHTFNSLRIEKAYRDWPHDIGPADYAPGGGPRIHLRLAASPADSSAARRSRSSARRGCRSGAWCSFCWRIPSR